MTGINVLDHQDMRDVFKDIVLTHCFSKAGLAEGTNDATIKILAPNGAGVDFSIDGVMYHKAEADNIAMTACDAQAADTYCKYLVTLQTDGDLVITKGEDAATAAAAALPDPPDGECVIGYFQILADGQTWTCGTDDLGETWATDTYVDLACLPSASQID